MARDSALKSSVRSRKVAARRFTASLVTFAVLGGLGGFVAGKWADPFETLASGRQGVLIVAHGCGYSLQAVDDLKSHASGDRGAIVVYVDPQRLSDCDSAIAALPFWGRLQRRVVGPEDYCRWLGTSATRWFAKYNPDGGVLWIGQSDQAWIGCI